MNDSTPISRRGFLGLVSSGGTAALLASLPGCARKPAVAPGLLETTEFDPLDIYPFRGWESLYREQFKWDKVVRSTHSANCTGSCSWMVYVKDGVMVREEQASDYPRINADLPDYNPRGCQKGACFVEYVYGAQRLKYPLIRKGLRAGKPVERGSGQWERVSWDEALDYIADKLLTNIYLHGPDTNTFFSVIPAMSPVSFAAGSRLCHQIGGVFCSFYDWYCDLPPGEPITWGVQTEACECADWFNAKYIVLWGANIVQTRIPDAHFAFEARYHGAKICAISPDFNSSCVHADHFLQIQPGTDALLAMGLAKLLVDQGWINRPYILEQTDLPLLVRKDTGKYLRESDFKAGGDAEVFYLWDQKTKRLVTAPGSMGLVKKEKEKASIKLDGIEPALEGSFTVVLVDGAKVEVTTVFEKLKEE
ncbi:MAG: molybdopterin-dependent oxidoreductase, partial [Planctomycetia bacterium]|nr:molybdopterin-dependent oxidoreductase [Planctomycetia bacterium]